MTLQMDIRTLVRKNYLKKVLLLIVLLVAMTPLDANPFPVFCSDMTSAPDRVLTGCQFDGVPWTLPDATPLVITSGEGVSYPIGGMLSMTPKNRELFQVGRGAVAEEQDEKKENSSAAGATDKQMASAVAAGPTQSEAASGLFLRDEQWHYMDIDQDGTYLFFGDMINKEESTTGMDEDDFLPDGIGIGKKWRF